MGRGSPWRAPGVERARAGWRVMGEAWARGLRGLEGLGRRPVSCRWPRGPWSRNSWEIVADLASGWMDSLLPALPLMFSPSKSDGGSRRQEGDLGPREAPSRVRAEPPCPSLGTGRDSALSKGPYDPLCWTGLPPAWGPDGV